GKIRSNLEQFARELVAVHVRHGNIGDRYIKIVRPRTEYLERLPGIRVAGHLITDLLQHNRHKKHDSLFVVDIENSLSMPHNDFPFSFLRRPDRLFDYREIETECRASARLAVDRDGAVVVLHDAVDDGQSQSRAFIDRLRRKKRIEDTLQYLFIHPAAVIA